MTELTLQDTDQVGGGLSILAWIGRQVLVAGAEWTYRAVMSGQVDYAGVAEQQGTYYNMVGA